MNLLNHKLKVFTNHSQKEASKEPIWLEYLMSDGNQYIDTEVYPNQNLSVSLTYQKVQSTGSQCIMGCFDIEGLTKANGICRIVGETNLVGWGSEPGSLKQILPTDYQDTDSKCTMYWRKNEFSVNSYNYNFPSDYNWTKDNSIYLFNGNTTSKTYSGFVGKIYSCLMYYNDRLVRNLRPCLHPITFIPAFYDTVSKHYYYNMGTGEFSYDISFVKVDYLKSDGNQWILTDIKPNTNTVIDCEFSSCDKNAESCYLFGVVDDTSRLQFSYSTVSYVGLGNSFESPNFPVDESKHKLKLYNGAFFIDGRAIKRFDNFNYVINKAMPILGLSHNNVIDNCAKAKLYSFKTKQNGIIELDCIPVRRNNGIVCLYNFVTGEFLCNSGTGELKGYINDYELGNTLESDGYQWINTGFYPNQQTTGFKLDFELTSVAEAKSGLFGSTPKAEDISCYFVQLTTAIKLYWISENILIPVEPNVYYSMSAQGTHLSINGIDYDGVPHDDAYTGFPLYLFNVNEGDLPMQPGSPQKIHFCNIFDGTKLVRQYVPATKNNKYGMLDILNGNFYENEGTGDFVFNS